MENRPISVSSLIITKFRKFDNQTVEFKKPITLITGQNGTAKSTLLGMLAQPFSFGSEKDKEKQDNSVYIGNYHDLKLFSYNDIAGRSYTYPCDKIFRLSKLHDTLEKEYLYETKIEGIDFNVDSNSPLKTKKLLTVKQGRSGRLRFVTGPGIKETITHNSGEGNFPHPVIYLSLGRLRPLAEVKSCNIVPEKVLDESEYQRYNEAYKEIFSIVDEEPQSGLMETKEKKRSIVPLAEDYDGESCSAGQDNIGRILTALLSFRRLKEELKDKYRGGLLLIDELDATLHPSSQVRLMKLLCRVREELSLQIVTTTHSLYLIEHCETVFKKSAGIIHIRNKNGDLEVNSEASLEDIKADLKNEAIPPSKRKTPRKISVILEDGEAVRLFKYLIKQDSFLKNKISIANIKGKKSIDKASKISGCYLQIFADNAEKIPELQKVIFVPDGDMSWAKNSKNKNIVSLPGDKAIEIQIFEMLSDAFWESCEGRNYSKSVAIGNYPKSDLQTIDGIKKWYSKQRPYWGRERKIVLEKYYQTNKKLCDAFLSKLRKIVYRFE